MRSSILARSGAVFSAAALALTLAAGSATAAESTTTSTAAGVAADTPSAGARPAVAGTPASDARPAAVTASTFKLRSGVILSSAKTSIYGDVAYSGSGTVSSARTEVRINGTLKGSVDLYAGTYSETGDEVEGGGVDIPRGWGSGAVVLGPTTFTYSDSILPTVDETKSNTFYLRKNIKTTRGNNVALTIKRVNNKITHTVHEVKIINPSSGQYVSAGSVKLQYLSGSTWKTKKTIKLNSSGNGSYSRSTSSKYRYRLLISKTATNVQFTTRESSKI